MKKLSIILLLTISLLLCSCSTEKTASNTTSESLQSIITPTGVSEGQYEQPTIYFNGNLYSYNFQGRQSSLANQYVSIGSIENVDMYNMPTEDFHATGVDLQIGQEVYAETTDNPSVVFVEVGNEYVPLYLVNN